MLLSKLIVLD